MPNWRGHDQFGWPMTSSQSLYRLRRGTISERVRLEAQLREGLPAKPAEDSTGKPQDQAPADEEDKP